MGIVFRVYASWCLRCQEKQEAEKKAAAKAATEAETRQRVAARDRIPGLLTEFRARPFAGVARPWTEPVERRFRGGYKQVRRFDEPAVPLGTFGWTFYLKRTHPDISDAQKSARLETGLTASGELVIMDVQQLHSGYGTERYKLVSWQEVEICAALEALLAR